ncbi:hypothetical protein REH59_09795 [Pseudomonas sp. BO3-4]|uniref:hypothetical protein n=1 Tax=Pseudomonas sp. BO3-4 TaxID=3094916 RepID=UPI002A59D633|nr:hypothetical protein [Pseudomonas sp. BO3-4]WPO31918.1 hypothetical protein REH59_09795 [Pseudomonas sp. BO3-4]
MFVTHESWSSDASALLGEGHTCMRIVEWQSCYHFYQVIVEEKQNEKMIARQYFLSDVDVLEDVLEKQSEDFKVAEVLLMSPAWMNGGGGWAMNKVLSLIVGQGEGGGKVSMHKVAEGVVYTSPAGGKIDTLEEEGFKVLI